MAERPDPILPPEQRQAAIRTRIGCGGALAILFFIALVAWIRIDDPAPSAVEARPVATRGATE